MDAAIGRLVLRERGIIKMEEKGVCAEVVGEVDFFVHRTAAIGGGCKPGGGGFV